MMTINRALGSCATALIFLLAGCGGSGGASSGVGDAVGVVAAPSAEATVLAAGAPQTGAQAQPSSATVPLLIESMRSAGNKIDVDPFKTRVARDAPTPGHVLLPAINPERAAVQKAAPATPGAPIQIGIARDMSQTATTQQVASILGWSASARGGKVAALRFQSAGAKGVRLGLLVRSLPLGGVVRFYADGSDKVYEAPAQEILGTIQRNIDAGDSSDAARTYWSPNLGGEAITVEFEVPREVGTDTVQVAVPSLSHNFASASEIGALQKVGEAGTCNLDVSCSTTYSDIGRSVALMDFVKNGASFVCTGTLLNDAASSGTPYFLSANHCISTQTVASTLWTYWFYKSASCNSTQINAGATWIKTGASLLYASAQTDTSFMRLSSAAPAGALHAAWSPTALTASAGIFGVHHPRGDLQKYSVGISSGTAGTCVGAGCGETNSVDFWKVNWTAGTTEGGSSGSGLFRTVNGKHFLVGQLFGGNASCSALTSPDYYGRFDIAYNAALSQWLGGVPAPPPAGARVAVYRLYNNKTQTHFYTRDVAERDRTIAQFSQFTYEGVGFYAQTAQSASNSPVYRFFNTRSSAHFYTVSAAERAEVRSKYPWYTDEGVSWYVDLSPQNQAAAMHRFYNTKTQTHFYTISATERDVVAQQYPEYNYEGIAYYAWTSP